MPRLEPIPLEELAPESRRIIDEGVAAGVYATPVPLQIFAYRTAQLQAIQDARTNWGGQTLLGGRILELLRIRSAQLGECQPCMQSRKHDSITDDDVACLLTPGSTDLTEQERLAVRFLDLLSADHHAMDDAFYRELGQCSPPPRSSSSASPAPRRWASIASSTRSTCSGATSLPSATTRDRSTLRSSRRRRPSARTGASVSSVFATGATGRTGRTSATCSSSAATGCGAPRV